MASSAPADDILEGAQAIADFMGWPSTRRVYQVRESGGRCPIRKREGMGLYAFKSELNAWLTAPETLPIPPGAQAAA